MLFDSISCSGWMKRNALYKQLSSQCTASSKVPTKLTVQVQVCVCVNYSSQVKSYGWKSSLSCLQLSSSSSLLCLHSFQSARVGMFSTASLARTSLHTHTKTKTATPLLCDTDIILLQCNSDLPSSFFPKISWLTFWKQQFVIFRSVHIYVNKTH